MTLRLALLAAAAASSLSLAACGEPDQTALTTPPPATDAAMPDAAAVQAEAQTFVNAAGQAALAEIETSKMAVDKAKNADVKAFAQALVDEHTAASAQLAATAQSAGLSPPATALDDFHMRRVNDLTESDGDADFDADYAALQVDAHKDAIDLFEDYARDGDVPALKAYAEAQLARLREHQATAEQLNTAVRGQPAPNTPG